jgi:hypothetical protein
LGAYLSAQTREAALPAAEFPGRTPESVMREYGRNNLGGLSLVSPAYRPENVAAGLGARRTGHASGQKP